MNILGLLDLPSDGQYLLDNQNVEDMTDNKLAIIRNKKIGFIFQSFNLLPKLNAIDNVTVPLMYYGMSTKQSKEIGYKYLEKVGLKGREKHLPSQLSRWTATKSSNSKSFSM